MMRALVRRLRAGFATVAAGHLALGAARRARTAAARGYDSI
jgi:hypothetical protein